MLLAELRQGLPHGQVTCFFFLKKGANHSSNVLTMEKFGDSTLHTAMFQNPGTPVNLSKIFKAFTRLEEGGKLVSICEKVPIPFDPQPYGCAYYM